MHLLSACCLHKMLKCSSCHAKKNSNEFLSRGRIRKTCQRCLTQKSSKNDKRSETLSSDTLNNPTERQINLTLTNGANINEEHLITFTEAEFPQFLRSQFECFDDDIIIDNERIEISCQIKLEIDKFLNPKNVATKFRIDVEREDGYKWK